MSVYRETRTLSVRIELDVSDQDDSSARRIGEQLAEKARKALEADGRVQDIRHASYVLRKR